MGDTITTNPPWQACGATHVAVYGTLRAGGVNDIARLRSGIARVGTTLLTGTLHDLGWYPGLSLSGTAPVLAEVYPLDDALEQALDRIECVWPQDIGEYAKRVLDARVALLPHRPAAEDSERTLRVLVYEAMPAALKGAPVIAAQDWLVWHESRSAQHQHSAASDQNRK
ncbi:gamma-glutamylcyclotransferase family protein [Diaphorobacter aerolatus]|uniref:Gamma-glutamylcyclotransferase n=1 Tax=Diaphorobacter aerolatus TaxID=1288495 RepID=A0A7H0GGD7_9BURK|nr:gamma-glutamylcyclotransferase family protein [Diaphorobacter aerolatus]QNP47353.1 gamma-glutamylcyclotransferase [Diaphorobacter aerolatus]